MTKEIFERALELDKEMQTLSDAEFLFMNCTDFRELVLQNMDDGHKIINRAVLSVEAKNACLYEIRKLRSQKMQEFENL